MVDNADVRARLEERDLGVREFMTIPVGGDYGECQDSVCDIPGERERGWGGGESEREFINIPVRGGSGNIILLLKCVTYNERGKEGQRGRGREREGGRERGRERKEREREMGRERERERGRHSCR